MFVSLSLSSTSTSAAQTDEDHLWTVEQRCIDVPAAENPAAEFPGTILLDGWAGIHAMQADWDTTHIVAFLDRTIPGGALSPDGHWYANPIGFVTPSYGQLREYHVSEIWLHNTENANDVEKLQWSVTLRPTSFNPLLRWHDDEHLIYVTTTATTVETRLINIATGETTFWDGMDNLIQDTPIVLPAIWDNEFTPSLDWGRALTLEGQHSSGSPQIWTLYQPATGQMISTLTLADFSQIAWSPDSAFFAAEVAATTDPDADNPRYALALFDHDGAQIASMFNLPERARVASSFDYDIHDMMWSSDGRYLAFITYIPSYPPVRNLYIVDTREQTVIDTCLAPSDGLAWSPDGSMLALMAEGDEHRPLYVLDVESEQLSWITRHEGNVIGWRDN